MTRRSEQPLSEVPADLPEKIERAVRRRGAIALRQLTKVKLDRQAEASLHEALARCGLERTGKHLRVPLAEQVTAILDAEGHLPFQTLKRRVKGAVSATELRRAVAKLCADGVACFVMEGRRESVAHPSPAIIEPDQLASLKLFAGKLTALLKTATPRAGRPSPTLWRRDVAAVLALLDHRLVPDEPNEPSTRRESSARQTDDARRLVADALRTLEGRDGPLVYVPRLYRELAGRLAAEAVHAALLTAAAASEIELRPDSGVGTLDPHDAALCPRGPDGAVLSYARVLSPTPADA